MEPTKAEQGLRAQSRASGFCDRLDVSDGELRGIKVITLGMEVGSGPPI